MYPNLKAELARKGWTAAYLAELLGRKPAYISTKMNGKYVFSLPEAIRIKQLLGVDMTIEELFMRKEA